MGSYSSVSRNRDSKARVKTAAGDRLADLIPDRLYSIMGGYLAWYCEVGIIEHDRAQSLGWIAQYLGTLAQGRVVAEAEIRQVLHGLVGQLVVHGFPAPSDLREKLEERFESGKVHDAPRLVRELTSDWGDDRHRAAPPTSAPVRPEPTQKERNPSSSKPIQATPFQLQDPASLPRRDWLYGTHLIRKEISATLAPGGVGKTSLGVAEALAIATAKPLLGVSAVAPRRVWLWNGEEPQDELMRRIHAACIHYGITNSDLQDRLLVDNGHDLPLVLVEQARDGTMIYEPVVDALTAELRQREVDVMICDPFVSTHNVTENDNNAIQKAATAWKAVAVRADVAIGLAHHTRKLNGREATAEDSRGADSLIAKCRDARALNPMSQEEARALGILPIDRFEYFWTGPGGKSNMAKRTGRKTWFRMVSVGLGNAEGLLKPEDKVGVVTSWQPDYIAEQLKPECIEILHEVMKEGQWRAADQSIRDPHWIGVAVAQAFKLDRAKSSWTAEAKKLVRRLEAEGFLRRDRILGAHRKMIPIFKFVRPAAIDEVGDFEASADSEAVR